MIQANLFISSFKKHRKTLLAVISAVVFLALLFFSNRLLWYLLVDDTASYTRVTLHELYHQEENLDVLFLGSSHCYRSFDTAVTDEQFGANTFNGGSSSQSLDGSYALLVEAGKKYHLKKVYVEMYYVMMGEDYKKRKDVTPLYIISDYMKPSFNRVRYIVRASSQDDWINGFFPERRNWTKLFESQYVSNLIAKKSSESYKDYGYIGNPEKDAQYYAGKGYVANTGSVQNANYSLKGHFGSAYREFSKDDIKELENIIAYCQKRGIELAFFSAPMSDFRIRDTGDYDAYVQYVKDFFEGYQLPYYDFNLCKEPYFSYDSTLFKDTDHLNAVGAQNFSRIFSEFFMGKISETDLFYPSYEEKMDAIEDRFYGLVYTEEAVEGGKDFQFEAVQNRDFDYYATVLKKPDGADSYEQIQALEPLDSVLLPADEAGQLLIHIFKDKQGKDLTNEITIRY